MIRGVHTMFYSGLVTHMKAPGGFVIQLYQPTYSR